SGVSQRIQASGGMIISSLNPKISLAQIDPDPDKLLHWTAPSLWRSGDHALALDAVWVGPSTPSLRANGSGECPPDDRLREQSRAAKKGWMASSLLFLATTDGPF